MPEIGRQTEKRTSLVLLSVRGFAMEPIVVGVMGLGAVGGTVANTPKEVGVATVGTIATWGVGAPGRDQSL